MISVSTGKWRERNHSGIFTPSVQFTGATHRPVYPNVTKKTAREQGSGYFSIVRALAAAYATSEDPRRLLAPAGPVPHGFLVGLGMNHIANADGRDLWSEIRIGPLCFAIWDRTSM